VPDITSHPYSIINTAEKPSVGEALKLAANVDAMKNTIFKNILRTFII